MTVIDGVVEEKNGGHNDTRRGVGIGFTANGTNQGWEKEIRLVVEWDD